MRNLLFMGLLLTSCQFGPNYYNLDAERTGVPCRQEEKDKELVDSCIGYGYQAAISACFLAKSEEEMTDEEWAEQNWESEGQGYYDGVWIATHPGGYEALEEQIEEERRQEREQEQQSALLYFDCEDGTGVLIDDEGEVHFVKEQIWNCDFVEVV